MEKENKIKCLKLVIEQIGNMLENNKEELGGIGENFVGWCEDGIVFHNIDNINNEEIKQCKEYMYKLANSVDNLTTELQKIYEEI